MWHRYQIREKSQKHIWSVYAYYSGKSGIQKYKELHQYKDAWPKKEIRKRLCLQRIIDIIYSLPMQYLAYGGKNESAYSLADAWWSGRKMYFFKIGIIIGEIWR